MHNTLAKREIAESLPHAQLTAIWHVDADRTYCIDRTPETQADKYYAVRTLAGRGELRLLDGRAFDLSSGTLAIFAANTVVHYATVDTGWEFYWFEFHRASLTDACDRVIEIRPSGQERRDLERCFACLGSGRMQETALAEALFNTLLADWQLTATGTPQSPLSPEQITFLLEKGRREGLGMAQLAHEAGMCERSFRNAVHQATGLSPKAYLLKGEMTAAMELLRTTAMTVAEVADCLHYSNPFYFSRVFKQYYGLSPQQVRRYIVQ